VAFMDKFWDKLLGPRQETLSDVSPQEALNIPGVVPGPTFATTDGIPPLGPKDHCDACLYRGTPAAVAVRLKAGGRLDFCGHHYDQHAAALAPLVSGIRDERPSFAKFRPFRPESGPDLVGTPA